MDAWMVVTYTLAVVFSVFFTIMTVVVTVGGIKDLKFLFKTLKEQSIDETDDGRVVKPAGATLSDRGQAGDE